MKNIKKLLLNAICLLFLQATVSAVYANPDSKIKHQAWSNIKHVVIIVFENTSSAAAKNQPYFKSLMSRGAFLSQYYAITHPSQPNYLALVGASTFKVTDDANYDINAKHIGNLLETKGYTWKSYAEAYPGDCYLGAIKDTYYRKHEPFMSFINVSTDPKECKNILPGKQFFADLAANQLPTYSLYVPDINNDGHDKGVAFSDKWLSNTFGAIFNDPKVMKDTLFILTFDEDDWSDNNKVYTVFLGAAVKEGANSSSKYNHYSTVRTIEDIFGLESLGTNDRKATPISDIWLP